LCGAKFLGSAHAVVLDAHGMAETQRLDRLSGCRDYRSAFEVFSFVCDPGRRMRPAHDSKVVLAVCREWSYRAAALQ